MFFVNMNDCYGGGVRVNVYDEHYETTSENIFDEVFIFSPNSTVAGILCIDAECNGCYYIVGSEVCYNFPLQMVW